MELKDLVGLHKLSGVDRIHKSIEDVWGMDFEDCQVCRFVLDGETYSVIEDPDDGYRSSMREIKKDSDTVNNIFTPQDVLCIYHESSNAGDCDILELRSTKTGKLVLRVGTDNTNDYYPWFANEWIPENMDINNGS